MNAKPDGYSIGMITFELNSMPPQKLAPFTYKDFDPVIRVNTDAAALTVPKDAPYNTLKEFEMCIRDRPWKIWVAQARFASAKN